MFQASAFLALALASRVAFGADDWSLEVAGGTAHNFSNRLKIEQQGGFSESVNASYDTRAFRSPPYYMLRGPALRRQRPVGEPWIEHFSVNRAFRRGDWIYRLGAGPVITHAEATILQTRYDGPYRLSGAGVLASLGRRHYFGRSTYLWIEGAVTAAYARPKMSGPPDARLTITNSALHFLVGVGHEF